MHFDVVENEIESPSQLKCDTCDFLAKNFGSLQRHRMSHRECNICKKQFAGNRSARDYDSHMATHTNEPKKSFKCSNCKLTFATKGNLDRHTKNKICFKNQT